jgi:hypothetical protein
MDGELKALIEAVEADPVTIALTRARERQLPKRHVIKHRHGPWDVEYFVEEREYGSEVIAMHIDPHGVPLDDRGKWPAIQYLPDGSVRGVDTPPLTRRQLRGIPLGPSVIPRDVANPEQMAAAGVRLPKPMARTRPTARAKRRPDSFYAQVAKLYSEACARGDRAPRESVARQLSANGTPCNSTNVRDWRREAERRELITATRPGRAGGTLTDKALQILADLPRRGRPRSRNDQ